jgi:hypothetical protein
MATTSVGNVHVNVPLTNLAIRYMPLMDGFVADEVAPRIDVVHESNLYYTWQQADFFSVDVTDLVPDRGTPKEIDFTQTTASYTANRRELGWTISVRERNNADNQLDLDMAKQQGVLGRLALLREARIAALLKINTSNTVVVGETITGGLDSSMTAAANPKWDVSTTLFSDFSNAITLGIRAMRQTIGVRPNTLIIPAYVAEGMQKSGIFTAAGGPLNQYTGMPGDNPYFSQYPLLPTQIFGMRVLVPGNIKNTAKEGQTASYSDVWGKDVTLLYVTDGPSMTVPSVAYTFQAEPLVTRQAPRDEVRRLDEYFLGNTIAEKCVAPFAGYTITAAAT